MYYHWRYWALRLSITGRSLMLLIRKETSRRFGIIETLRNNFSLFFRQWSILRIKFSLLSWMKHTLGSLYPHNYRISLWTFHSFGWKCKIIVWTFSIRKRNPLKSTIGNNPDEKSLIFRILITIKVTFWFRKTYFNHISSFVEDSVCILSSWPSQHFGRVRRPTSQ